MISSSFSEKQQNALFHTTCGQFSSSHSPQDATFTFSIQEMNLNVFAKLFTLNVKYEVRVTISRTVRDICDFFFFFGRAMECIVFPNTLPELN